MTSWKWYEAYPPRGTSLEESAAVMRVLATRPRFGLLDLTPLVVFELWITQDRPRWLIGMDERIADRLPGELRTQSPALVVAPLDNPERPTVITAREVRFRSVAYPVRQDVAEGVTAALLRIRDDLAKGEAVVVQFVVGPGRVFSEYPVGKTPLDYVGVTTPPEPDSADQQAWKHKLTEPLLAVRGRMGAVAAHPKRAATLTRPVFSALALANDRHGRVQVSNQSSRTAQQLMRVMGKARTWSSILNSAELAVVTGWNVAELDVAGSGFPPPPMELLIDSEAPEKAGRIAGVSAHPAARGHLVGLPLSSYSAHKQVVSPTGAGKSTILANWAVSEAAAGRSLVVLEPKGDLVTDILARLPEHRHRDVVVLDPGADNSLPVIGFNPLRGPREDAERRADSLLSLFRELFGASVGPRSSDVLLHALIAMSRLSDGTLTDVMPFLTNSAFRRRMLAKVGDPLTLEPWAAWFDSLSVGEHGSVVAPLGNKLRVVSARPSLRRLLGQANPKFSLDDLFTRPTVLLANLNAGAVGPEAAKLLGTLLLNQLWDAIQRQTMKPPAQRRTVPVIVDEFQNFTAGLDFADVLARARGANVSFTVAHQHLDQLSPTLKSAVLANCRSRLAFRPAEGDGRALAAVLGGTVTAADLERLPAFHAVARVLVGGAPCRAFEVATLPPPRAINDVEALRKASAEAYGVDSDELDAALVRRWQGSDQTPDAPVGVRRKQP